MFTYCNNNAVIFSDNSGQSVLIAIGLLILGSAVIGGFFGGVTANRSGGSFWQGFKEGAIICGGSALICTLLPEALSAAVVLSSFFGYSVDYLFQVDEMISGERSSIDISRWVKAGVTAPLCCVTTSAWGFSCNAIESLTTAFVTLTLTKQLSVLYGLFDIATTSDQRQANPSTGTTTSSNRSYPLSQQHSPTNNVEGGCGGAFKFNVLIQQ